MNEIKLGKKIFIRNAGKDEFWLQDLIYQNPEKLGLGDLIPVRKEKTQSSGGRLDILLKDPNDNTMYEIEVMLGETDPSHIIRSIEYWDNEKRKYPQRQHFAVLIAESFDRRYFNVIQLLSLTVPMIAIQADLLDIGQEKILNFTKILDVYVEQEDEEESKQVTETTWSDKASWTLQAAQNLFVTISALEKIAEVRYTQSYITIAVNKRNHYYFDKRTNPSSFLWFKVQEEEKADAIKKLLEENNIVFNYNKYKDFNLTVDKNFMSKHKGVLERMHEIKEGELNPED